MEPLDWDPVDLGPDPHATLAGVRSGGGLRPLTSGFWAATGHAEVSEVLRHPDLRSGAIADLYASALPPGAARDEMSNRINFLDPPDHPRVRGIVSTAFTPRRIASLRPWIEATADRLAADLDRWGADGMPVDLLQGFAHQVPSLVISEMLGVPVEDRDRLTHLSDAVAPLLSLRIGAEPMREAIDAAEEMHARLGELVDERSQHPGEDLLSALVVAEEDGERLSRPELMSLAATLYSAGHRTTRDLFANGVALLLDGGGWRHVVDGTWSVPDTVAELVRLATPTLFVSRVATCDTTVAGLELRAGAPVLAFLSAANRDPEAYERPDELVPGRDGPPSLSFAFGAHYCLGASLARSEVEVMLDTVVRRWPGMRFADGMPTSHQRGPFRGLDELMVLTA